MINEDITSKVTEGSSSKENFLVAEEKENKEWQKDQSTLDMNKSFASTMPAKQTQSLQGSKPGQPCSQALPGIKKKLVEDTLEKKVISHQQRRRGRRKQLIPRKSPLKSLSNIRSVGLGKSTSDTPSKRENMKEVDREMDRKTRGQRKRKKPEAFDSYILENEKDFDYDYDSLSDEYCPPKNCNEEEEEDDEEDAFEMTKKSRRKRTQKLKVEETEENPRKKRRVNSEPKVDVTKKIAKKKGKMNSEPLDTKKVTKSESVRKSKLDQTKKPPNYRRIQAESPYDKEETEESVSSDKEVKKKGARKKNRNAEPGETDYPDVPNVRASEILPSMKVKRRKRKCKIRTNLTKMKSILNQEVIDREEEEEEEEDQEERDGEGFIQDNDKNKKKKPRHGQPYSVTGGWYIASGYLQDLTTLLQLFEARPSLRFRDYSLCWQEQKFSLIYRGRQNFKELLEFSEEAALLTKRFLAPPHSLKWRVGALYTIYGLYYKHPFRYFFKVRLEKDEYQNLVKLVEKFRTDVDNPDPAYIFHKMEVEGAFHHVASSSEMCLELYSSEREAVDKMYELHRLAHASPLDAALPQETLNSDKRLLEQYHKVKAISMGDGQEPEKAVSFVQPFLMSDIKSCLKQLKEDTFIDLGLKESSSKTRTNTNQQSFIGTRRAYIRAKAVTVDTSRDYIKKKTEVNVPRSSREVVLKRRKRSHKKEVEEESEIANGLLSGDKMENKKSKGHTSETAVSRNLRIRKSPGLCMDKDIRQFMSPPTAGTLCIPLKSRKKAKKSSSEATIGVEDQEDDISENSGIDEKSVTDDLSELKETQSSPRVDNSCITNVGQDYGVEDLNVVPEVSPPPKRRRGRPRKDALYKALGESKGNSPINENLPFIFMNQRGRPRSFLRDTLKRQISVSKPTVADGVDVVQINSPIIDLPLHETKIILPPELDRGVDERSRGNTLLPNAVSEGNAKPQEDDDSLTRGNESLTLDVCFSKPGTSASRWLRFKIQKKDWASIENNSTKIEALKRKLLKLLPPENQIKGSPKDKVTHIFASVVNDEIGLPHHSFSQDMKSKSQPHQFQDKEKESSTKEQRFVSPLTSRERGRSPKKTRGGKMLMVPIKVGDTIHYLPATSHSKVNCVDAEHCRSKSSSTPPTPFNHSPVIPEMDEYQISNSAENTETLKEIADYTRASSPDFISSDMNWMSPLYEGEIKDILSHAQLKEDPGHDLMQTSSLRRKEDFCNTSTSFNSGTVAKSKNYTEKPESVTESYEGPAKDLSMSQKNLQHQEIIHTDSSDLDTSQSCISDDSVIINRGIMGTRKTGREHSPVKSPQKMEMPEEEYYQNDFRDLELSNCSNNLDLSTLPPSSSVSESVSASNYYIKRANQTNDFSHSLATVTASAAQSQTVFPLHASTPANCPHNVTLSETEPCFGPCRPVTPLITRGVTLPLPIQPRQVQVSHPKVQNVRMPLPHSQMIIYSSPEQMVVPRSSPSAASSPVSSLHTLVVPRNSPLATSSPISSLHTVQHISVDGGINSNASSSQELPQCSPTWLHQASHFSRPQNTPATDHSPGKSVSFVTYQKVPVYSTCNQPTNFLENQSILQSELDTHPQRFSGVVKNTSQTPTSFPATTSTASPIVYLHNPSLNSVVGLNQLPSTGGCKLVKIKINDESLMVPLERVLTSASKVTYKSQISDECETLETKQVKEQEINCCSLPSEHGRDSCVDDKNFESISGYKLSPVNTADNQCPAPSSTTARSGSNMCSNIKTEDVEVLDIGSKTYVRETQMNCPKLSKPPPRQICSFLFSQKYKALSVMKETIGPATGSPVKTEKPRVPFFLKQSLVRKKKS